VVAYAVFYLLPQSLVLFGPFVGMGSKTTGSSTLASLEDLLVPALVLGALYPLARRTRYEGLIEVATGIFVIFIFFYVLGGGSVSISTVQTASTGLLVNVTTELTFVPLLLLLAIPVCVFIAKGLYLLYSPSPGPASNHEEGVNSRGGTPESPTDGSPSSPPP